MSNTKYVDRNHNYLIDCFRILAVLMVLTVHVRTYLFEIPESVNKLFEIGAYGVALYFLISGYLTFASVKRSKSFVEYIAKKSKRILPMYYVSLVATFVIGGVLLRKYPISWEWVYHVFFLNMFIPAKEWMWWNSVNYFWTMPSFITWYMLCYFVLKRLKSEKQLIYLSSIAVIISPSLKQIITCFSNSQFAAWNFFVLMYIFLMGVLAYIFVEVDRDIRRGSIWGGCIVIIGVLAGNRSGFFVFGVIFYAAILLTSNISIAWKNKYICKVINNLSKWSYSVYLTHWFILTCFGNQLMKLHWIVAYITFIVASVILGCLCYRYIEYPCSRIYIAHQEKCESR